MKRIVIKGQEVVLKVLHRPEYLNRLILQFKELINSNTQCSELIKECKSDEINMGSCRKYLQSKYHPDRGGSLEKSQLINECAEDDWLLETTNADVMHEFTETIRDVISKLEKVQLDADMLIRELQMTRKPNQVVQVLEEKLTKLRDNLKSVATSSRAEDGNFNYNTALAEEKDLNSNTNLMTKNYTALSTSFQLQLLVSESETHFAKIIRDMMHDLTTLRVLLKFCKEAETDEELMRLKEAVKSMFGRHTASLERAEGAVSQNSLIYNLLYFVF